MAKKNKAKQHNIPKVETSMDLDVKKLIITSVIVFGILVLFYLLTLLILKDDSVKDKDEDKGVEIQYSEIVLGSSFNQKEDKYLVLYYDSSDEETYSSMITLINSYNSKGSDVVLYTIDMNNGFNSKFLGEEGNRNATKASEMVIKDPTLILFEDHTISDYIEGKDDIEGYLK